MGDKGGGEAVLQLQHARDLGTGWMAEEDVQTQTGRAVWMEPGQSGRYRVAAQGRRWWGWHMTWQADHKEGVLETRVGRGTTWRRKEQQRIACTLRGGNIGLGTQDAWTPGAAGGVHVPGGTHAVRGGGH